MTSIAKHIWQLIDEDPSIKKDLVRGIINVSALAAYLRSSHGLKASQDSVVSAVRRYKTSGHLKEEQAAVRSALVAAVVTTKSGITSLRLKNSSNLYRYLSEMMRDPQFFRSEIFRLIKSREETLCMIDRESLEKAKSFFPEGNIVQVQRGLAEINLLLTPEGWQSKGVLASLANEVAAHGVNIVVVASAEPRIRFFVEGKDLPQAHEAVLRLMNGD